MFIYSEWKLWYVIAKCSPAPSEAVGWMEKLLATKGVLLLFNHYYKCLSTWALVGPEILVGPIIFASHSCFAMSHNMTNHNLRPGIATPIVGVDGKEA